LLSLETDGQIEKNY